MKIRKPAWKSRFRPIRSASDPADTRNIAKVRAYASKTHCRSAKLLPNEVWICGRAMATTLRSSISMKVPRATTPRVHHRPRDGISTDMAMLLQSSGLLMIEI